MYKKRDVIILPTDEKANTPFYCSSDGLHLKRQYNGNSYVSQHLYILSDEKIKESDWAIEFINNVPTNVLQIKGKDFKRCLHNYEKLQKIIATTDKSLSVVKEKAGENVWTQQTPQIPQSFIEHYVSEYNKGNVITEVMVEYNEPCCKCDTTEKVINCKYSVGLEECNAPDPNKDFYGIRPKVDPKGNTINTKLIKDSWSKEEVIDLLNRYAKRCQAPMIDTKWIEENL